MANTCILPRASATPSSLFPGRGRALSSYTAVRWLGRPRLAGSVQCNGQRRPQYVPSRIDDPCYVRIFDTTLRDGEQSPGATLTSKEKLDIARQLTKLGVDIIEAGFPIASPDDLEAVKLIAKEVGNYVNDEGYVPVICGLARCNKADIDAAWEGVKHALRPRIHTFIATSEIHMQYKLRKSRDEVVKIARDMVSYARSLGCEDIEFSPEDAGRSDPEFLFQILEEVIRAGATTLNIPDTVGYTLPGEFGQLIAKIKANTKGADNVIISTHCQNDLGLATANTLAGAVGGARQLEVTLNGIGERAGNASLEEVVMAIKCRAQEQMGGLYTGIQTKHIAATSKMVADYTGMLVQPHKAIVGANAFAHESGIHQDGMLKYKGTYEILSPDDIGLARVDDSGIVLGKHSGRHALKSRLQQLGYDLQGNELDDIFHRFKAVAEKKKKLLDEDLEALLLDKVFQPRIVWALQDLQVVCGSLGLPTATVKLVDADGVEYVACSVGTGPVDAALKAVDSVVKIPVTLLEYSLTAVTEGIDAIATTRVVIRSENAYTTMHAQTGESVPRTFSGTGASMDVVVSSVRAYVSALNKMLGFKDMEKERSTVSKTEGAHGPKSKPINVLHGEGLNKTTPVPRQNKSDLLLYSPLSGRYTSHLGSPGSPNLDCQVTQYDSAGGMICMTATKLLPERRQSLRLGSFFLVVLRGFQFRSRFFKAWLAHLLYQSCMME